MGHLSRVTIQCALRVLIDLILYSREQIAKENAAMTKSEVLIGGFPKMQLCPMHWCRVALCRIAAARQSRKACLLFSSDPTKPEWFIVSIKAQDEPFELPMNPIT